MAEIQRFTRRDATSVYFHPSQASRHTSICLFGHLVAMRWLVYAVIWSRHFWHMATAFRPDASLLDVTSPAKPCTAPRDSEPCCTRTYPQSVGSRSSKQGQLARSGHLAPLDATRLIDGQRMAGPGPVHGQMAGADRLA